MNSCALEEKKRKDMTPLKLLKLAYLAHGQSLFLYGQPLIYDAVEAWRYGPVIPTLYYHIKEYGGDPVKIIEMRGYDLAVKLDEPLELWAQMMVEGTFDALGDIEGVKLSAITHRTGSPWETIYEGDGGGIIKDEDTRKYYESHRLDGMPWGWRRS